MAVLVSGAGTNLQALLDDPDIGPSVVLVVSSRAEATALERAGARGIKAVVLDPATFETREAHDEALLRLFEDEGIEFVLFAGYMRILTPVVLKPFQDRWLNVHPSLLPAFPGAHPVREALESGVKVTGVTVHFVVEEVDQGPIVLQEAVPILSGDDERTLHARIQRVEHRLYPRAARLMAEGKLKVEGRRVHILGEDEA
jgi:phosphoribosylglycinamide formyltransferase-1